MEEELLLGHLFFNLKSKNMQMFSILIIKTMFYTNPFPKFNEIFLLLIKTLHEITNMASQLPLLYTVWVSTGGVFLWEFQIPYICSKQGKKTLVIFAECLSFLTISQHNHISKKPQQNVIFLLFCSLALTFPTVKRLSFFSPSMFLWEEYSNFQLKCTKTLQLFF